LAPYVGADLSVMEADTIRMRTNTQGLKPFVMTNLRTLTGLQDVVDFIVTKGMLPNWLRLAGYLKLAFTNI